MWTFVADADGDRKHFCSRFVVFGSGYYNYSVPLPAQIEGIEDFQGRVLHPQFWPVDYDYSGKKIVVVGSGATAVSLIPALAEKAAHVTMLQRSPSYIFAIPSRDVVFTNCRKVLGLTAAGLIPRTIGLVMSTLVIKFCNWFPRPARHLFRRHMASRLPSTVAADPHFTPRYNPWEQRMCLDTDGDLFEAIKKGTVSVATDTIERVTATGVQLKTGQFLDADVIVTATGLNIRFFGGAEIFIDGKPLRLSEKFLCK